MRAHGYCIIVYRIVLRYGSSQSQSSCSYIAVASGEVSAAAPRGTSTKSSNPMEFADLDLSDLVDVADDEVEVLQRDPAAASTPEPTATEGGSHAFQ